MGDIIGLDVGILVGFDKQDGVVVGKLLGPYEGSIVVGLIIGTLLGDDDGI